MVDYFTHYYKRGSLPFQSLSILPDSEALKIIECLCDDSPICARFKEPLRYLEERKQTERWLRNEFIAKGGLPKDEYPLYAVLGTSCWIEKYSAGFDVGRIQIPISILNEGDISFTYPDSMVSYWLGKDKPARYYQSQYNGKVFTLSEIRDLVNANGLPEEKWETPLPEDVAPYIEVQIWNHKPLLELSKMSEEHIGV